MTTLRTERLDVIACPERVAVGAYAGVRQLETLVGAKIARDWLADEGRGLLNYYWHFIRDDSSALGYGLWLLIHRADQRLFGTAGFKGKPNADGEIEIGYGIDKAYRRQGYTYEAARALCDWAFQQPDVRVILAECLENNIGSVRVLEKLGMRRVNTAGAYIHWRLEKA
jgi:ribosomal-protein-alanine N-acetyltransferase